MPDPEIKKVLEAAGFTPVPGLNGAYSIPGALSAPSEGASVEIPAEGLSLDELDRRIVRALRVYGARKSRNARDRMVRELLESGECAIIGGRFHAVERAPGVPNNRN